MGTCYKDLKAWQKSMELTIEVYRATQGFPNAEMYGLTSQMRRAAVSVPSNIAEGKGKSTDAVFALFLCHARGSLQELETQTLVAARLGYLQDEAAARLAVLTLETGKMLNGLIQFLGKGRRRVRA